MLLAGVVAEQFPPSTHLSEKLGCGKKHRCDIDNNAVIHYALSTVISELYHSKITAALQFVLN